MDTPESSQQKRIWCPVLRWQHCYEATRAAKDVVRAVALVIFMVVILFKPQGLLGHKEERKV